LVLAPVALVAAGAFACSSPGPAAAPRPGAPAPPARVVELGRIELDLPDVTGLSDLSRDASGGLWAVAERRRFAVRIASDGAAEAVPIAGVPDGLDIEGMAWLPDGRVALATESNEARRPHDAVFFARLAGGRLEVEEERRLAYRLWPMEALGNQGIEGLCQAGDTLVMAIETVLAAGGVREAPIAIYHLPTGRWTPLRVRLTTRTGKISALACALRPGGAIDVLAIERHFEVAQLIRFAVPPGAAPGVLEAVLVGDLGPLLPGRENYEGLVWDGAAEIAMVADNDWTHVTGPNLLVTARLDGPLPSPAGLR